MRGFHVRQLRACTGFGAGANEPETRREFPNCSQQSFEALLGRKMLILFKFLKGKSCSSSTPLPDPASPDPLQPPLRAAGGPLASTDP